MIMLAELDTNSTRRLGIARWACIIGTDPRGAMPTRALAWAKSQVA